MRGWRRSWPCSRAVRRRSVAAETPVQAKPPEVPPEQPSYQEILDRRAVKVRDLELRELSLHNALDQLKVQQRQLADGEKRVQEQAAQFAAQVKSVKEGAEAGGRDVVLRTLETIKPKQAKEQLAQMLENNEIDQVVLLLCGVAGDEPGKNSRGIQDAGRK